MNISKIHNCYGCGVCAISCTKNIISIELNDNGFYEPRISDVNKCTDCGLCFDVYAIQLLYNKLKRLIRRISNPKKTIVNFFNRFSSSHSNKLNAPTLK